ncbi:MAG TPA: hypothetical protein PLX77_00075 [Candidatus Cloacimonadota bacterium]|nr:hypothetical protein [Candidatus Cloacimonadota bacterium]
MIMQYIKLALRQIRKHKSSFAIAIIGLAISLAAAGLLISYSLYYLDFDKGVQDHEQWYRLRISSSHPDYGDVDFATFYINPATMLLHDIPEVKDHILYWPSNIAFRLTCEGKPFPIDARAFVTPNFLQHYKMEILYGNPDSLLVDRFGLLISESFSKGYFGEINPVGKKLEVMGNPRFHISAVFKDFKANTHIKHDHYSLLINDDADPASEDAWFLTGHVRLKIPDKADLKVVETKLDKALAEHRAVIGNDGRLKVHLDPVAQMHFIPSLKDDEPTMSILNVWSILAISIVLIVVAILNFLIIIGLSWKKRADEFQFRQAVGAGRLELFHQLMWEYALHYTLAVLLGIGLYAFSSSVFGNLVQVDTQSYNLLSLPYLFYSILAIVLMGTLSGLLMSLRHARIFLEQNAWHSIHRNRGITILLFVQMMISFCFVVLAISVAQYYNYIRRIDWGWDTKNTIQYNYITVNGDSMRGYYSAALLKDRLMSIPGVEKVTSTSFNMASSSVDDNNGFANPPVYFQDGAKSASNRSYISFCLPDLFPTRDIEVLEGRIPEAGARAQVVVNNTFAKQLSADKSVLGRRIRFHEGSDDEGWYEIAAVVEDSRFFPAHLPMIPMIYAIHPSSLQYHQITWQEDHKQEVLPKVEEVFRDISASGLFGYKSKEIELAQDEYYAQDRMYKNLNIFMAVFVLLISIMGIYAVSSASIHSSMKDISIRKVCGAELSDLLRLYLKKYLYLYIGAAIPGLYAACNMISLFQDRFAIDSLVSIWGFPLALLLMALVVFIPLYINVLRAFKADANRYLQAE